MCCACCARPKRLRRVEGRRHALIGHRAQQVLDQRQAALALVMEVHTTVRGVRGVRGVCGALSIPSRAWPWSACFSRAWASLGDSFQHFRGSAMRNRLRP
jgi:hypothetical protein